MPIELVYNKVNKIHGMERKGITLKARNTLQFYGKLENSCNGMFKVTESFKCPGDLGMRNSFKRAEKDIC